MLNRIPAVVLLTMAVLLIAASCRAEVYRNEEYGIDLQSPDGVLVCRQPEEQHDHGVQLLWGTVDRKHCFDFKQTRYIDIYADYNTADDTMHLPDFLKSQCVDVAKGPCGRPPDGLEITGLPSAAARVDLPDRWTDIIVVTQAGTPDPDFDPSVPTVNYTLTLHTKVKYLEEDLCVFRVILQMIRINPD